MRITTRLSTAGEHSGYISMPEMREPASAYRLPSNYIDEVKVRKELADHCGILMSSDDSRDTLAITVDLLDRMKTSLNNLIGKRGDLLGKASPTGPKSVAERRFERGKFAFVRVDIRHNGGGGFRILISATDPKRVVGNAKAFAELYAQAFADNIVAIADHLNVKGIPVVLIEKEGCDGVFEFARRRNAFMLAKERHATCRNRHGIQCSPVNPGCELYNSENGHCRFDDRLCKDASDGWKGR